MSIRLVSLKEPQLHKLTILIWDLSSRLFKNVTGRTCPKIHLALDTYSLDMLATVPHRPLHNQEDLCTSVFFFFFFPFSGPGHIQTFSSTLKSSQTFLGLFFNRSYCTAQAGLKLTSLSDHSSVSLPSSQEPDK